jgi:hypothetical protein
MLPWRLSPAAKALKRPLSVMTVLTSMPASADKQSALRQKAARDQGCTGQHHVQTRDIHCPGLEPAEEQQTLQILGQDSGVLEGFPGFGGAQGPDPGVGRPGPDPTTRNDPVTPSPPSSRAGCRDRATVRRPDPIAAQRDQVGQGLAAPGWCSSKRSGLQAAPGHPVRSSDSPWTSSGRRADVELAHRPHARQGELLANRDRLRHPHPGPSRSCECPVQERDRLVGVPAVVA